VRLLHADAPVGGRVDGRAEATGGSLHGRGGEELEAAGCGPHPRGALCAIEDGVCLGRRLLVGTGCTRHPLGNGSRGEQGEHDPEETQGWHGCSGEGVIEELRQRVTDERVAGASAITAASVAAPCSTVR
jgi:hypothetical protein